MKSPADDVTGCVYISGNYYYNTRPHYMGSFFAKMLDIPVFLRLFCAVGRIFPRWQYSDYVVCTRYLVSFVPFFLFLWDSGIVGYLLLTAIYFQVNHFKFCVILFSMFANK